MSVVGAYGLVLLRANHATQAFDTEKSNLKIARFFVCKLRGTWSRGPYGQEATVSGSIFQSHMSATRSSKTRGSNHQRIERLRSSCSGPRLCLKIPRDPEKQWILI